MQQTDEMLFNSWEGLFLTIMKNFQRFKNSKLSNNLLHEFRFMTQNSSVNIVTIRRAGKLKKIRGSILGKGKRYFIPQKVRTDCGVQPASCSVIGSSIFLGDTAVWARR
jgi:hypothetical protein